MIKYISDSIFLIVCYFNIVHSLAGIEISKYSFVGMVMQLDIGLSLFYTENASTTACRENTARSIAMKHLPLIYIL